MSRMVNPDMFGAPERDPKVVVNEGYLRLGINVDRPPAPAPRSPDTAERWAWSAVAAWKRAEDLLGVFDGIVARCDTHPRLERLSKRYFSGRTVVIWFVNGVGVGEWLAALEALALAEAKGLHPGKHETYLGKPRPAPIDQAAAP